MAQEHEPWARYIARKLARWYAQGTIDRSTFTKLWATEVYHR